MKTFQHKADLRRRRAFIHQLVTAIFLGGCLAVILINIDPLSIVWR